MGLKEVVNEKGDKNSEFLKKNIWTARGMK